MDNPLKLLQQKVEEIKADVFLHVRIALARETVDVTLSRLKDLDPENADLYEEAQALLGGHK